MNKLSTFFLSATLVFLAMAGVGWKLGSPPDSRGANSETTAASSPNSKGTSRSRERLSTAHRQVDSIKQGGTPEQRLRATVALAHSMSPSDFPEWFNGGIFNYRDGFELTIFRKILEERWRTEDPEGFVAWCLTEGQSGPAWAVSNPSQAALPILKEWAVNDAERLNAFFASHPNEALEAQLITELAKSDPALALAQIQNMLGRGAGTNNYQITTALQELAKSSPAALEASRDQLPGDLRLTAEGALVGLRLSESFQTEIASLWERPDGWTLFANGMNGVEDVSSKLLAELSSLPDSWKNGLSAGFPYQFTQNGNAEKWLNADLEGAGFTDEQAARLRSTALRYLASQNPELALTLLPNNSLTDNGRSNVILNMFNNLRRDPEKANDLLAQLDFEQDRENAQKIIDSWTSAPSQTELKTADAWIEGAMAGTPEGSSAYYLNSALRSMDKEQVAELTSRFATLPEEQKNSVATILSNPDYGMGNPELTGLAVRYLVENSPAESEGRDTIRLAASTAARWARTDPNAASAWVQTLPEGEPKLWAQQNLASSWNSYDPDGVEAWVATLPAEARTAVREFLDSNGGN